MQADLPGVVLKVDDPELRNLFVLAKNGDDRAMVTALAAVEPLLARMVKRYGLKGHKAISRDDLLQEARQTALIAIRRYDQAQDTPPGAFVGLCVRRTLRDAVARMERRETGVYSLDKPLEDDDTRSLHELLAATTGGEMRQLETLIDRLPANVKSHHRSKLPDDQVLIRLLKDQKTASEIGASYGVRAEAVTKRVRKMRENGIPVPTPHDPRSGRSTTRKEAGTHARATERSQQMKPAQTPQPPETRPPAIEGAKGVLEGMRNLPVPTLIFENEGAAEQISEMATHLLVALARCGGAEMRLKIEVSPAETRKST